MSAGGGMKWIEELGGRIDARWRAVNYDEAGFTDIAVDGLQAVDCPSAFFHTVTAWALADQAIAPQIDPEAMFGQPPICLYVNPLQTFYIQALVWLDATTSVHRHGFSGAFKVVEGESLHARHDFEATDPVNARIVFGKLRYRDAEVLSVGDVRPIIRGDAGIHAVFHLRRPSITLVVRTMGDTTTGPQYDYLRPHLAVDPFYKSPRLQRNLQVLSALREVDRARYLDTLAQAIPASDLYTGYRYLRQHYECPGHGDERTHLAALVHGVHGERGDRLVACLEQVAHDGFLIEKRKQLRDPEHRFLLALLLNVPDRASILRLVRSRYPDDAVERVVRWIGELCDGEAPLLRLGESTLVALRQLVRTASRDDVVRAFAGQYGEQALRQRGDIEALCDLLRTASHFKPLFAGPMADDAHGSRH